MDIRKLIKSLLLIFVVFSLTVLVYREFSPKNDGTATVLPETQADTLSVPDSPDTEPVKESLKQPATKSGTTPKGEDPLPQQTEVKPKNSRVIAYYFHGTFRCSSCRAIERYSQEAIEKYFDTELRNGKLEFRHVNVEEPENRHFIQNYQLFTRSLVLSMETDGKEVKWKNLADVWKLLRDRDKFFQYVKDEVEVFLKETG